MELNYVGNGKIYFNEKEYRCDLYLNEDEGGIAVDISIERALASIVDLPINIDFLVGELSTGFKFSLMYCKRNRTTNSISEGRSIYSYYCRYLLKGIGKKQDRIIKLNKVNFQMLNTMAWGNISAYKISDDFELSNSKDIEKEIYTNDKFEIKYWVNSSILPINSDELLREKIIFKQNGNIEIIFKDEVAIDKFIEVFNKVRRLIELCTLKKIYINKITGWSNNIFDVYDGKCKIKRPIQIIGNNLSGEESSKGYSEKGKWINLSELIENDSFSKYFSKYERLEPVIELYIEIIYSKNISNRRIFLNIAQALETYHSRFKTNNIDEFKERIDKVILKDRPKEWAEDDRKFLLAKSKSFITFESRLADLLLAEFQIYFDTGDIKRYDFPKIIAQTRNYYIHYDETIKNKSRILIEKELAIYNRGLIYILEYYILIELGFLNIEKVNKKLRERWGRISETLSIIKYSDEKWNID